MNCSLIKPLLIQGSLLFVAAACAARGPAPVIERLAPGAVAITLTAPREQVYKWIITEFRSRGSVETSSLEQGFVGGRVTGEPVFVKLIDAGAPEASAASTRLEIQNKTPPQVATASRRATAVPLGSEPVEVELARRLAARVH